MPLAHTQPQSRYPSIQSLAPRGTTASLSRGLGDGLVPTRVKFRQPLFRQVLDTIMSALDSRYAENSRLKNSSVSTVGLPAFKEQMDAMRQAMVKRKSASETLGYMLHLVGHNAGGAENKAEPEKKATAKDISKPVADRPPESRAGTTMPLHPFADLKHGQLLPVRKLNRMSYPSDKAQRDSIHGALDYRRENAKAPDFKNDLWRFRQRLNPLRDNRLKAEVSLLGEGFMTVYPEGMHDRALRLEHGLPAESPEGRKDAPVLTIGPKAAPSRYYGAAGEAMWGHLPASGKVKVRAALKKMSRHLNQVAGHESVHATQKVMPYDRRGLGGRTRGLVPNETLPPGFKRQLFRDSRQSPDASAERRRAIGEEEFEASAQELKTRLYHMGVDPYEDGAQAKVMDILQGDRADETYPGYFKGMSDKEIEAMAPTLMHVIRGVADNKPQQVDDPMSGAFDGISRNASSDIVLEFISQPERRIMNDTLKKKLNGKLARIASAESKPTHFETLMFHRALATGGMGRMGGPEAAGPGGTCTCPKCGAEFPHDRGVPCAGLTCPECGASMDRETTD